MFLETLNYQLLFCFTLPDTDSVLFPPVILFEKVVLYEQASTHPRESPEHRAKR